MRSPPDESILPLCPDCPQRRSVTFNLYTSDMEYREPSRLNPYNWKRRCRVPVGAIVLLLFAYVFLWPRFRNAHYHGITYCTLTNTPAVWYNPLLDEEQREITELHEQAHVSFLSDGNCVARMISTRLRGERLQYEAEGFCAEVPAHIRRGESREHVMRKLTSELMEYPEGNVVGEASVRAMLDRICGSGREPVQH